MTPENDKTERGIFSNVDTHLWNDRLQYKNKFEDSDFSFTPNGLGRMISFFREKSSILKDDHNYEAEDLYMQFLSEIMPESKTCHRYLMSMTFGMSRNFDGTFSFCDCCGRALNFLNSTEYGMCDDCNDEHLKIMNKDIDLK